MQSWMMYLASVCVCSLQPQSTPKTFQVGWEKQGHSRGASGVRRHAFCPRENFQQRVPEKSFSLAFGRL